MGKDLSNLSTEELGKLFPIKIDKYNPQWPEIFEKEKEAFLEKFNSELISRIEHYGSTSIVGCIAKPTIDILFEINDLKDKEDFINHFEELGYRFLPQPNNPAPHMMFVKGYSDDGFVGQVFHVHVRYKGDWDELYFRDYLRRNTKVVTEYGELKKTLSEKYKHNRELYTEAKTEFIKKHTELAKKEIKQ